MTQGNEQFNNYNIIKQLIAILDLLKIVQTYDKNTN